MFYFDPLTHSVSHQDLSLFGSNELIYVPGSPLPIMIEEAEEEEDEVEDDMVRDTPDQDDNIRNSPPSAPPRSKVARTSMTFFNEHFIDTENSSNIFNIDPLVISPPIATLRKKSKKSKSEPVFEPCAFDDPVLDVDPNYDEPNLIINQHSVEPDETPVTLPRKRRGKIKANLSTSRADVSPSPPPRLYATLPPRKKNSTLLDASVSPSFNLNIMKVYFYKISMLPLNLDETRNNWRITLSITYFLLFKMYIYELISSVTQKYPFD